MSPGGIAALGVALPLAVSALLVPLRRAPRRLIDAIGLAAGLAVAAIACYEVAVSGNAAVVTWFGGWMPHDGVAIGIAFRIDRIGATFAAMAAVLTVGAQLFAWWYFREVGTFFQTLMLAFLGALVGFSFSGDLFNMFVFFELMSVAGYALTAYRIEEPPALSGAINFAITNSVGAFLVLLGIALVYGRTGALNLAQIGAALAHAPADGLVVVAFALLATGFFVKAAIVPFHFWLDDAHAVAPTPLCVLFSGIMVQLGLYAVARVYFACFAAPLAREAPGLHWLLIVLGAVTALVGGLMALQQCHVKRLLAFSTLSHSGVFLCGLALLSPVGIAAMTLFIVAHGLTKASLFMGCGIMLFREGTVDERELYAKGRAIPFVGIVFVLGAFALADVPPFATYAGKAMLDAAIAAAGIGWLPMLLALACAFDSAAVFRVAGRVFAGLGPRPEGGENVAAHEHEDREEGGKTPWTMILPPALMLVLCALLGLQRWVWPDAVTTGAHFAGVARAQAPHVDAAGNMTIALTVVLALTFAALAIYADKLPRALRGSFSTFARSPMGVLRALHSGVFGDYVAWVVAGVAFFTAWLAVSSR